MNHHLKILLFIGIATCFTLSQSCKIAPSAFYQSKSIDTSNTLQTLAFGSCNKSNLPQDYWQNISNTNPDLWVWLGDIIYGDTKNINQLRSIYDYFKSNPAYANFVEQTPIIGVWDDHDYGVNDGGKEFVKKPYSQELLFDFLDVPKDAAARISEGAYQSYTFGEQGQQVKIILLDTRYFRDALDKNPTGETRYLINESGDILGKAQWEWLEKELTNSTADIHIIGSSIQVIAEEQIFEKWANFPTARQRFFDLLEKTQPKNPILLSGDRHIGEIAAIKLDNFDAPIHEITSSGLTHAYTKPEAKNEKNQYRVSELINEKHFAILKFDWKQEMVIAEIHSTEGGVLLEFEITIEN